MIEPTVGRVLWYCPSTDDRRDMAVRSPQPLAAHVAFVHDARCVNLLVIDHAGVTHQRERTLLCQSKDERPQDIDMPFCEWMPYQKGLAAKTEQLEQKLEASP